MQPSQTSKPSLADTAALTGGAGLAAIILFFVSMVMGLSDGSLNFLVLLVGGVVLGVVGFVTSILALARKSTPKYKAVIGLITGLINIAIVVLIILFIMALTAGFSAGA